MIHSEMMNSISVDVVLSENAVSQCKGEENRKGGNVTFITDMCDNSSIILRHKSYGNGPIRSEISIYWESPYGHGNGPIGNPNMGNTQYGNSHVPDQVECSMNSIQQKLLQNSMCIL
jgi:hypothetical protein